MTSFINVVGMQPFIACASFFLLPLFAPPPPHPPTPNLTPSLPSSPFSPSGRASPHLRHLAHTIGDRAPSTPGNLAAAAYLESVGDDLQALARAHGDHVSVEVLRTTHDGAFPLTFFNHPVHNAYRGITNVAFRIRRRREVHDNRDDASTGTSTRSSILLNAHYDSTMGSVGAADCAACVATALEVARAVVASPPELTLRSDLIVLLNGAEETLMQGAYAFHAEHPWREEVAVFVNLESTGMSGPFIVFQSAGEGTTQAVARAVVRPRGSVLAQDIFDAGIIPADTDFKPLASR